MYTTLKLCLDSSWWPAWLFWTETFERRCTWIWNLERRGVLIFSNLMSFNSLTRLSTKTPLLSLAITLTAPFALCPFLKLTGIVWTQIATNKYVFKWGQSLIYFHANLSSNIHWQKSHLVSTGLTCQFVVHDHINKFCLANLFRVSIICLVTHMYFLYIKDHNRASYIERHFTYSLVIFSN